MTAKKPNKRSKVDPHVFDLSRHKGRLKSLGGSQSDVGILSSPTKSSTRFSRFLSAPEAEKKRQQWAAVSGLIGISPRDECEGMIAAQLIAATAQHWSATDVR